MRMMMRMMMRMALEFCRLTFAMTSSVHFLLVVEGAAPLSDNNGGDEDDEDNLGTMMMMTLAMIMLMAMVMMTNIMKSSMHFPLVDKGAASLRAKLLPTQ